VSSPVIVPVRCLRAVKKVESSRVAVCREEGPGRVRSRALGPSAASLSQPHWVPKIRILLQTPYPTGKRQPRGNKTRPLFRKIMAAVAVAELYAAGAAATTSLTPLERYSLCLAASPFSSFHSQ